MTGRPTKLSEELTKDICNAIQLGGSVRAVCDYAGLAESTFYDYMKRGEAGEPGFSEFSAQVKKARGRHAVTLLNRIEQASKDGNWFASAWKLQNGPYREEYRQDKGKVDAAQESHDQAVIAAANRTREMFARRAQAKQQPTN